jgi:hypothetical protein
VDRGERVGLGFGEIVGVLQQRPAAVLERLRGVTITTFPAELVPVFAADLVERLRIARRA